jgi:hypothetical protein
MKQDEIIKEIAFRILGIQTIEVRNSDSLDFHDIAVWNIKKALETAFNAGKKGEYKP